MKDKIWIFGVFMISTTLCNASWGTPGLGQYHIQTDEGPERYFRYQTDNGQYRKEKRLQDGTVIGTDAWIDAAGYLRAKDYIADGQGYRILKSKTVFVGKGRPIEEAMRSIKNVPAQSGILANPGRVNNAVTTPRPQIYYSSTAIPSTTATIPTTVAPITSTTPFYSSTSIPSFPGYNYQPVSPQVFIRHHSEPLEDNNKNSLNSISNYYPTSTSQPFLIPPSSIYKPPYEDNRNRYEQIKPIAILSTKPSPIASNSISDDIYYPSSTHIPQISSTTATPFSTTYPSSSSSSSTSISSTTYRPEYSSTTPPYGSRHTTNQYNPITDQSYESSSTSRPIVPIDNNDLRVQPLFSRQPIAAKAYRNYDGPSPLIYNNNLGSGYDPQFQKYDGISVNRNGFSYYLPKQYHEEDNTDPQRRQGGFGYIDPFGIRRVIYYNTSPEKGFEHRKNNRYVGLDATPYDPRPL